MAGCTLMVSRAVKLLPYWKIEFEKFGFQNIHTTSQDKDGLNSVINDIKPSLMLIGSKFYIVSMPYMMGELLRKQPQLNIAVVNIHEVPEDIGMSFISNGVKSYVDMYDGMDEFHRGLKDVKDGKIYVSPVVLERIAMRRVKPMRASSVASRRLEVTKLICCGFKEQEIADALHISRRTVDTHKTEIFRSLNVRNSTELIRVALYLGMVKLDETLEYPRSFVTNPKPMKEGKGKKEENN